MRNTPEAIKPEFYRLFSKPLTIYELYLVDPYTTPSHYYVANTSDIVFGVITYTALAIKRSTIKSEEGTIINDIEVGLDNVDLAFRSLVASGALNRKRCVGKLVFSNFLSDSANYIILFDGCLDEPKGDDKWVTMAVSPFPILERDYPSRIFQVGCNWLFGSAWCAIDKNSYDATITTIAGTTEEILTFATTSLATDYFVPGYAEILTGDLTGQVRPILSSTATTATMRVFFDGTPAIGVSVKLQKLCAKNPDVCGPIFSNYINYLGFPQVPKKPTL
jgi:hypothetical protein